MLVKILMSAAVDTISARMVGVKTPKVASLVNVLMVTNSVLMVPTVRILMSAKKIMLVHLQECVRTLLELSFVLVLKGTNLAHLEETVWISMNAMIPIFVAMEGVLTKMVQLNVNVPMVSFSVKTIPNVLMSDKNPASTTFNVPFLDPET